MAEGAHGGGGGTKERRALRRTEGNGFGAAVVDEAM